MNYNYDERCISKISRYHNEITACKIIKVDNERGLTYELPWGGTSWIKPRDFEIEPYKAGQWIDMILGTVSSNNHISLKSAQYIGKTPEPFIPKE